MFKVQCFKAYLTHGKNIYTMNIFAVKKEKATVLASYWNFDDQQMIARLGEEDDKGAINTVEVLFKEPFHWPMWKRILRLKPSVHLSVLEAVENEEATS